MAPEPSQDFDFRVVIWAASEGGFCSLHPETGTASQGETEEEALLNLREALGLYREEFPNGGRRL
jgi:predicted RNase H-like HicB family nuclease